VRHPEEAARKRHLGKFYHRPPGGESWADVALRLRATYGDAARELAGDRVLVVTHEAPILLTRYLLDRLSERDLLDLGRRTALGNAAITSYERVPGGDLRLTSFNDSAYLHRHGAPSTAEPEVHGNAD
jgi:broad specificity phosphatase PhoE